MTTPEMLLLEIARMSYQNGIIARQAIFHWGQETKNIRISFEMQKGQRNGRNIFRCV